MCGLVGLAGDCAMKFKDVFTDLLYVDTLRGNHSTGAALVTRPDSKILLEKAPIPGPHFIGTQEYRKLMDTTMVKVMIGHNRYATIGEKIAANAHPFAFENTVGAHNGTIDRFALSEIEDYKNFGTDSEAVYNSIEKIGLKATIAKLTGAWALTYFNKVDNTINFLRNNKRPLYYVYSEDLETIMWASEAEMLMMVLNRRDVKVKDNRIHEFEPDTHYRWHLPKSWNDKFGKPITSKVEGYKYTYKAPVYVQPAWQNQNSEMWDDDGQYNYNYGTGGFQGQQHQHQSRKQQLKEAKQARKVDTKKFRPPYKDHLHRIINKVQFDKLVESGCVYCDTGGQTWGDFIHPLKDDMDGRKIFLCEACYNDTEIKELVEATI